jgi:hypothetical protein
MRREASFTGIFGELAALLSDAWREVALYTLVVGGLAAIGIVAGLTEPASEIFDFGFNIDSNDPPATVLFDVAALIVGFVANYLLLKRYLALRGRVASERNRFWPYLGMAILSAFALVFGLILLVVPGIILLVRWSAASGYVIGAGQGVTESLTSSWNATEGRGWPIFFAGLVLFLGIIVMAAVVGGISGAISLSSVDTVAAFVEAAYGAIFAGFGIAVYCLVQDDTQQLSEVFA